MIRRCTVPTTMVLAAAAAAAVAPTSGVLAPAVAVAQEPDPNVPVQRRPRPAYDPLGIRLGGFLVFPRLSVLEAYDSNVFAEPEDEDDDLITIISPSVAVASNFGRHRLGFGAGAEVGLHVNEEDEDYEDYFAEADGALDVTRNSSFFGGVSFRNQHEGRDSPDSPEAAAEPTEFDIYSASVGYRQRFNRLGFALSGEAATLDFDDTPSVGGGTIDEDDRDRSEYDAQLRVGYAVSPRFEVFTTGRYTVDEYDKNVAPGVANRDSEGYEIRGGVDIDITAILFGEIFGGYRSVNFDSDRFEDTSGFSFGAGLTWNVTPLTTIELAATRDVDATTVGGASSNFETEVLLEVNHELRRNLLINGRAGYVNSAFEGADRTDNTLLLGAGAVYLLNRYLALELVYRYTDRSSDAEFDEFSRNFVSLGVTGRL